MLVSLSYLVHVKRVNPWIAGLALELGQIICYILLITIDNKKAKYVFVMLATAASQSFYPLIWPGKSQAGICDRRAYLTSYQSVSEQPKERLVQA